MLHRALKLTRIYHKVKQNELAKSLSISNSYLSEIEAGIKTPTIELLKKYSKNFNLPLSSIMLFSEHLDDPKHMTSRIRSSVAKKLIKILEWIAEDETNK